MAPQPPGANPPKPNVPPTPIANLDDLLERAEDRLIPKGSTVRMSRDNPEFQSPAALSDAQDELAACGIKLVLDNAVGRNEIRVEPPAAK